MPHRADLLHRRFGKLTVIEDAGTTTGSHKRAKWVCQCDCGRTVTMLGQSLTAGLTVSCGCHKAQQLAERATTHGQSTTPEYRTWIGMIVRCENPNHTKYHHYGGKGIRVCPKWRESFPAFLADLGHKPTKKHTLERRDGGKDYTPENCYWATRVQQNNNTTRNRLITWRGENHTLADWARIMRLPRTVVTNRLYHHWSIERALTKPLSRREH